MNADANIVDWKARKALAAALGCLVAWCCIAGCEPADESLLQMIQGETAADREAADDPFPSLFPAAPMPRSPAPQPYRARRPERFGAADRPIYRGAPPGRTAATPVGHITLITRPPQSRIEESNDNESTAVNLFAVRPLPPIGPLDGDAGGARSSIGFSPSIESLVATDKKPTTTDPTTAPEDDASFVDAAGDTVREELEIDLPLAGPDGSPASHRDEGRDAELDEDEFDDPFAVTAQSEASDESVGLKGSNEADAPFGPPRIAKESVDGLLAFGAAHRPAARTVSNAIAPDDVRGGSAIPTPSEDTMIVQRNEADRVVKNGFSLANRNMLYSARREFLRALRLLAEGKDATRTVALDENQVRASALLTQGLRALEEAEDFRARGTRLESQLDMVTLVSSHQTPILKDATAAATTSALAALEAYYAHGAESLGAAVAGEPAGSMALYGLGRIEDRLGQAASERSLAQGERAVALYRAALFAHPNNPLAANEAGVLLARQGRLAEASAVLHRAVALARNPVAHHNLATVQQRLGQHALAAANAMEAQRLTMLTSPPHATAAGGIVWVDPATFAGGGPPIAPHNATPTQTARAPRMEAPPVLRYR